MVFPMSCLTMTSFLEALDSTTDGDPSLISFPLRGLEITSNSLIILVGPTGGLIRFLPKTFLLFILVINKMEKTNLLITQPEQWAHAVKFILGMT